MSEHTPGPWFAWQNSAGTWDINVVDEQYAQSLACVHPNGFIDGDPEANARLIAASPDLLKVCMYIEGDGQMFNDLTDQVAKMLQSAIAKAKGES